MAVAGGSVGGLFVQGGGGKTAAALRVGNSLSVAARAAAVSGPGADAALPGTIATGQRARRSRVANRGTSAGGFFKQRLSPGRFSTPFSASVSGLSTEARNHFWPNCHVTLCPGGFGLRATTRQSSAGPRASVGSVAGVNKNHSAHRQNAGAGNFKKTHDT